MAERVFIVFAGPVVEFTDYTAAEAFAAQLVESGRHTHATFTVVDRNWRNTTMVVENQGVVLTTPDELRRESEWSAFDAEEEF